MNFNKGVFQFKERIYYLSDIMNSIKNTGIEKGDIIFVHADVGIFGKLSEIRDRREFNTYFLQACLNVIGNNGTLVVPTFTYSFCLKKPFDIMNSPSTLNFFTEVARTSNDFIRSDDPIFSVVSKGNATKELIRNLSTCCLGKGSIFERLHKNNAKILMLDKRFHPTFIHYIEEYCRVPYRYDKIFSGNIIKGELYYDKSYTYYVRNLEINPEENFQRFHNKLMKLKVLNKSDLGAASIMAIKTDDLFKAGIDMLKNNPYSFVKIPKSYN